MCSLSPCTMPGFDVFKALQTPVVRFLHRFVRPALVTVLCVFCSWSRFEMDPTVQDQPVSSVELLRSLVPREKISELASSRSNLQGLLQTAFHAGCAFLTGLLVQHALGSSS